MGTFDGVEFCVEFGMDCARLREYLDAVKNIFPSQITNHKLTLRDGSAINLLVDPSETYGHALARTSIKPDDVACISIDSAPIWYAPDDVAATR